LALREKVFRGGVYLSVRQGAGLAAGVIGVFLLTRMIGPVNYGLYRGALEIAGFLAGAARLGIDAYLVRREKTPSPDLYHQAFTFLVSASVTTAGLGLLILPLLGRWLGDPRFLPPLRVLLLALPVTVLSVPAVAMLERELDYGKVAGLEAMGQILYHLTAVLLAWRGLGVWAPVAGYLCWQAWMASASWILARYRPRWIWSFDLLREMLSYGVSYSAAMLLGNLRSLVNPLVVGRYLGPSAVGNVALAMRFVELLGFVKTASLRLSLAALARVQQDLGRLCRALEEALGLQALTLGAPLSTFALLAPLLLPPLFGERWMPALHIYPFIAFGYLMGAVFGMHASVLFVLRRNGSVAVSNAVVVALLAGTSLLLVPRLGVWGYGLAEITAVAGYPVIHTLLERIFRFRYSRALPWLAAFVPPLFAPLVPLPWELALWIPAGFVAVSRTARDQVGEYWRYWREQESRGN